MSPQGEKKHKLLERLAEENGVAVVVLDENSREISASNNNSMCQLLWASPEFAPRCAQFCGVAFRETGSGKEFDYECHAGLTCKAIPVTDRGKRFVAIVGRTFNTADNYRKATEKAISGEWSRFSPDEFFDNVLLAGSESNIDKAVAGLSKFRVAEAENILELEKPKKLDKPKETAAPAVVQTPKDEITTLIEKFNEAAIQQARKPSPAKRPRAVEAAVMRSLYGRLSKMEYREACAAVLEFLWANYGLSSLVWLEHRGSKLTTVTAIGALRDTPIRIGIAPDNERLLAAANNETSFELRERVTDKTVGSGRTLHLFATVVGGDVRGAIAVEGQLTEESSRAVARFCRRIGPQVEILRLRREVSDRDWLNRGMTRFNESLSRIDADDFWTHVTQVSAELVQSERASLLIRSDQSDGFFAKAAVGARINLRSEPNLGEGIAKIVLDDGKPVLVEDIRRLGIPSAPSEWKYKTSSFISYPILIGERRIGVMNFTDKAGGYAFDERDMELLKSITPHIAVAIDRTVLKDRAGELEHLSVTDSLTGLPNRRYLDKRLVEEIQRSKRHRFPMSLMMLDIDKFKSYNDTFGHQAGDAALKIVANVLHDILRGADVAARYGGEEFAILLPQTSSNEAAAIAERLRQRIEHTEFPKRKVTVSIGIAACSNEIDTPDDLIGAADYALYDAKNNGRNNIQIYDGIGKSFNQKIN